MPTTLRCPNATCLHELAVADGQPRPARCPACKRLFPLPTDTMTRDGRTADGRLAPSDATEPSRSAARNAAPTMIGRFVLKAKIGAGAFGTVYRAYDPQLDRELAVKVLKPSLLSDATRVGRFLREAKAAANLRHPNIVPVYDAGVENGRYFIASAFVDGQPLNDAIPDGGVPFRRAAELVGELAEALAYAHSQGVIHRDVKPHNCMVDGRGHLHLMDFGLARRDEDAPDPGRTDADGKPELTRLTNDGAVMGTPAYMAPEQAAGNVLDVGPASDQYAAGVVLYELLTGEPPFTGPPAVVIHNLLTQTPKPPSKVRAGLPKDLEAVCLRAMSRQPADRYRSCTALADDLRRWLDGETVAAGGTRARRWFVDWVRRRPLRAAWVMLAIPVLLAISGLVLAVLERGQTESKMRGREDRLRQREKAIEIGLGRRNRLAEAEQLLGLREAERARQLLQTIPEYDRGWEWRHLTRVSHGVAGALPTIELPMALAMRVPSALPTLRGHTDGASAAAFSPDGARVWGSESRIGFSGDSSELLHQEGWGVINAFPLPGAMAFSKPPPDTIPAATRATPDGAREVRLSPSGKAVLRDRTILVDVYALPVGDVHHASFSPDGHWVVTVHADGKIRLWDGRP